MRYYLLPLLGCLLGACSPDRTGPPQATSSPTNNRYEYLAVDEAKGLDGADGGTVRHISDAAAVTKLLNAKAAEGWDLVQIDRWAPYSGAINGNMGYTSAKYIFRRLVK